MGTAEATAPGDDEFALHVISDATPGIRRVRRGKSFAYLAPDGSYITDGEAKQRIRRLAIPPAWTDVWISPDPLSQLQATGRDAKGRKQYRYHTAFREDRERFKFDRLVAFGRALPQLRAAVTRDLRRREPDRRKVCAALVRTLERTYIRIGNREYERTNRSLGLCTLRRRNVHLEGAHLTFEFAGKGGRRHRCRMSDATVARLVTLVAPTPGSRLFRYRAKDGAWHALEPTTVNRYLRETAGREFTAKDFRTWAGTVAAASRLRHLPPPATKREAQQAIKQAVEHAAEVLGNTPTIARKSYVHPAVIELYQSGELAPMARRAPPPVAGLSEDEAFVLATLRRARGRNAGARAGATAL